MIERTPFPMALAAWPPRLDSISTFIFIAAVTVYCNIPAECVFRAFYSQVVQSARLSKNAEPYGSIDEYTERSRASYHAPLV